jgi:DNA-binding NarL/FixJ family response regulator
MRAFYVLKSDFRPQLIDAIEALAADKPFFTGKVSDALLKSYLSREKATLSDREQSIARLIAEGHTNNEVAKLLNISLKTMEQH